MYLTRMPLNAARWETRRLVASPYRLHAAVQAAFPPGMADSDGDCDGGRILWRLDHRADEPQSFWLYIVSPDKPDLTHVVEQAGWPVHERLWETKDYRPFLGRIEVGQRWEFRLKANPVRKVREDKGRRPNGAVVGKLQGHVTVEQQLEWLASRAEAHGFSLVPDANGCPGVVVSQRNREAFQRGAGEVTLATAVYDGVLTVTDADRLRATLCQGLGRAKGFGCGLLTLAPERQG